MRKHKLLILALVVLLGFMPLYATDYYVKNGGNDAASGLDDDNAWETIAKVNGESFSGDDNIYFNRGDTWRETLTVPDSGTSGHQITFGAYGEGADPIINGSDLITPGSSWSLNYTANHVYKDDANLQGLWLMEEASGTRYDETANSNDLTDNNTVTQSADQKEGTYSAEFDHDNSEFLSRANADLSASFPGKVDTDLTVVCWAKRTDDGESYYSVVGMPDYSWYIRMQNGSDRAEFHIADDSGDHIDNVDGEAALNTWYHYGMTYDGTDMETYVDGVDQSCPEQPDEIRTNQNEDFTVSWGSNYFHGVIDEVAIFDRALSAAEIASVYNNGVEDAPTGVWKATLTTEPKQVFFDGTRGTLQASAVACDAEFDWYWAASVLYVYSASDPDTAYTDPGIEAGARDHGALLDNMDYITIEDIEFKYMNWGSVKLDNGASNNIIDTITASYDYYYGFFVGSSGADSSDNILKDSTISYSGSHGVRMADNTANTTIQNNTIHHNCQLAIDATHNYSAGIKANANTCTGLIVENNTVYSEGDGNTGDRGYGIWCDSNVSAPIIRYNKLYSCRRSSIYVEITSDAEVYYNLSYENYQGITLRGGSDGDCHDNHVYNNVFYNSDAEGMVLYGDGATTDCFSNNLIRNNIVTDSTNSDLYCVDGAENDGTYGSGNVYEYNCFDAESADFIVWGAATPDTYDAWEALYGSSTNSVEANPLMTDPANDDFTLQSSSPCIDAGTDVSLTEDYNSVSVPLRGDMGTSKSFINVGGNLYIIPGAATEGYPDIGAYEYIAPYKIGIDGYLYLRLTETHYLRMNQPDFLREYK